MKHKTSLSTAPKPKRTKKPRTKTNHKNNDDDDLDLTTVEATSPPTISDQELILIDSTITPFSASISAVESLLNYRFQDKSLIKAALTHSSFTESESYQRLEFIGDAALGLALANFVYLAYRDLDPGQLSLLRSANISTEKLARVAVRHGFYNFMRHNAPSLDLKVKEFALAIEEEGDDFFAYGGAVKAPKVLADLTESVAAAIYVDCGYDLRVMWEYFSPLLEPIVTLENIQQQPVTLIYEHCQKQGKSVDFQYWKEGTKNICNVLVDGELVGHGYSDQKDIAKLTAAKEALLKLDLWEALTTPMETNEEICIQKEDIEGAKQKLNEYCDKKRWPKPTYSIENQVGPGHDTMFIYSVQINTPIGIHRETGELKRRKKDAENSAASMMIHRLTDTS